MERVIIPEFIDKESGLRLKKTSAFVFEEKCLLHEAKGHIIILQTDYLKELKKQSIPKEILRKLVNRQFVEDGSVTKKRVEYECQIKPEFIMIDLTNKCNMRCKYCLRNVNFDNETIEYQVLEKICKYISEYCEKENLQHISIQPWGGEPLLEIDFIIKMRQLINPSNTKVHFSVETNGLLLNKQTINLLYNNKIGLGISIDGIRMTHDAQRVSTNGLGTYDTIEKNILLAKQKYGNQIGTITTITRNSIPYIEEILEYFATKLNLTMVKFNFVHNSRFSDCSELCLSNEEISNVTLRLLKKIVELNERGFNIKEHNIYTKLKNILFNQYTDICLSKGCCGGRKMIVFDMKGNYYPCELTDIEEENIGNIYEDNNLIESVNRATKTHKYFVTKSEEKCKECEWYIYCKGGCTVRIMNSKNNSSKIDEIECSINTKLYPALVELILSKPEIVNKMIGLNVL